MIQQPYYHSNSVVLRRASLLVLIFLIVQAAFLPAATAGSTPATSSACIVAPATAPLLAEASGLSRVLSFLEAKLSDRRHMVQLAAFGMCIGLYILMRK
jgi:hypothetical protein